MTPREQSMEALAVANERRTAKARIKRELRAMDPPAAMGMAADLIEDHDGVTGALRLGELLLCVPRCGREKTRLIVRRAGVLSVDRRLRDLTRRERESLAVSLRSFGPRSTFWMAA